MTTTDRILLGLGIPCSLQPTSVEYISLMLVSGSRYEQPCITGTFNSKTEMTDLPLKSNRSCVCVYVRVCACADEGRGATGSEPLPGTTAQTRDPHHCSTPFKLCAQCADMECACMYVSV